MPACGLRLTLLRQSQTATGNVCSWHRRWEWPGRKQKHMNLDETLRNPLDPDWSNVAAGTPVFTNEGQRLGTVRQKRDDGLLVRGEDGQGTDYLVPAADIGTVQDDGVRLIINNSEAIRAHWQGTSPTDRQAPGAMIRESPAEEQPS